MRAYRHTYGIQQHTDEYKGRRALRSESKSDKTKLLSNTVTEKCKVVKGGKCNMNEMQMQRWWPRE